MRERIKLSVNDDDVCSGKSQQCPAPTVKIEKVNGGLRLFGVVIGNNCVVSLPAFGILFLFIGIILTIVAFKGPGSKDDPTEYENREATTRNIRVLGPICTLMGVLMLAFALWLKHLSNKAEEQQTRVGFYCPVHGDFYPLSPASINLRKYSCMYDMTVDFAELSHNTKWWPLNCTKKNKNEENTDQVIPEIPTCPHSISTSNRSSFDTQHICISKPTPTTVIITAAAVGDKVPSEEQNQTYGSLRSLSVPNDVVSFPSFRSRSNPPTSPPTPLHLATASAKRLSCPTLPEIGAISPLQIEKLTRFLPVVVSAKAELMVVEPMNFKEHSLNTSRSSTYWDDESRKRKCVSILLPPEEYHTQINY